jgi:hypothetical protein
MIPSLIPRNSKFQNPSKNQLSREIELMTHHKSYLKSSLVKSDENSIKSHQKPQ